MSVDIKVRGYHLDIYRHVNNGRYLEFLEEARWDYLDRHHFPQIMAEEKLAFVVVNININYRRPAYDGEVLRVTCTMEHVGTKSARMAQQIWLLENGEPTRLVSDAAVTFCVIDPSTEKPVAISGRVREIFEQKVKEGYEP